MRRAAALSILMLAPAVPGVAQETVDLVFEPPVIASEPICVPQVADEVLIAKWEGYDGAVLPAGDTNLIKRELRRLIEMDAARWFDVVAAAQAQLQTVDPSYSDANVLIDRIELLIAAGRLKELGAEQLVPKLLLVDLSQTPRAQVLLAGYLMRGMGIAKDDKKGEEMMVSAAYGGNADAILALVQRDIAGNPAPGWDVPRDLAVTMAFGALVGRLDPLICDRVNRIAREYKNGDIVTRDPLLSERWFRFAADLGDAVSAWRVAEIHLRSEDIPKDNKLLLRYLTKAAEGGLPYAQVALAKVQATGALVPKDPLLADETYRIAAADWPPAKASRALFLQEQSRLDPSWTPKYQAALRALVATEKAPAWALMAEADRILAEKGRWAGEAEAKALLERALAQGELSAEEKLTKVDFRTARSPAEFYAVMDRLIQVMVSSGNVDPMLELSNAFICRAPNAPQVAEADYWGQVSESTATLTVDFTPEDLERLAQTPDPIAEAELQTQALTGRATAIAQYLVLLDVQEAPPEKRAFWESYALRFPGALTARAALKEKAARTPAAREEALELFRKAIKAGEVTGGKQFAEALLEEGFVTDASRAEALAVLLPLAERGMGDAMEMLPIADPAQFPSLDAVFKAYGPVIDARGDFDALLLALPRLTEPARFDDYLTRASAITACTFDEALRLADTVGKAGDRAMFERWVRIADYLAGTKDAQLADLGDLLARHGNDADAGAMLAYYEAAREGGSRTAVHRLLNIYSRRNAPQYDPQVSAELFVDLVQLSAPEELPATLGRLRTTTPEIKAIAYKSIDETSLYLEAAQSGNAVAMREYAILLRSAAGTPADVLESTDWLRKAADAGDARAMIELADALVFGIGVDPSREDAIAWLEKAADLGDQDASARLRTLDLSSEAGQ
ncbi:MAG: sel1 repeat family protein [Tabrizicola sp.]|nr:sel1 repeat family protein [Tabrizicola sp.]